MITKLVSEKQFTFILKSAYRYQLEKIKNRTIFDLLKNIGLLEVNFSNFDSRLWVNGRSATASSFRFPTSALELTRKIS
jgi:hypothetical protein